MINWSGGQWANPYINQYFYEACFSSWSKKGVSMVGMVKLGLSNDSFVTLVRLSYLKQWVFKPFLKFLVLILSK